MRLFDHLDDALLRAEQRKTTVKREAFIWPSSASATLYDQTEATTVGKCHRAEVWKMMGEPETNPTNATSARRFRMGRACEADVIQLSKDAGIFVASGVRAFIPDINMTLELDLVVKDPATNQAVIIENKSIYGYFGNKEVIQEGKPKMDAVMQELVYLNEFRNGETLRAFIKKGVERRAYLEARLERLQAEFEAEKESDIPDEDEIKRLTAELAKAEYDCKRNRIEVDEKNVEDIDNGPIAGKLAYESRDECETREFDLEIWEDPVTKKHYPMIDGEPYRWFDVEDIYARWRLLKERYNKVRDEAVRRVEAKGVKAPEEGADFAAVDAYWSQVGEEMRKLPKDFLPPAEFEWKYSDEKIERMFKAGALGKTKYGNWKKKAKGYDRLGDWHCGWCSFGKKCIPMEYPEMRDLLLEQPETEAA